MLSFIRRRLTATNSVLVIALVLAMSGGAYAASKVLITSIKDISPKVVKQLKGERGERGLTGERGATGPEGAKGEVGQEGKAAENLAIKEFTGQSGNCGEGGVEFATKAGKGLACNGAKGTVGKEGEAPTIKEFTGQSGNCGEGGVEFATKAGKGLACNGKSAGGTLEQGKTERGAFEMTTSSVVVGGRYEGLASITFPIPLATSALPTTVDVLGEEETSPNCEKSGPEATAAAGVLCVYIVNSHPESGSSGAPAYQIEFAKAPYGYVLAFSSAKQESYLAGEWALTAS